MKLINLTPHPHEGEEKMNEKQRIRGAVKKTEQILSIDPYRIDQTYGSYSEELPCCVGAHLAHILRCVSPNFLDYLAGVDAFAELMGGNRAHVILMLRSAGAAYNPLSTSSWPIPIKEVWQNLMQIETLPSLQNADLRGADLRGADLCHADLRDAYLRKTVFSHAYLRKADLCYADLRKADVRGADVRGANLCYANLYGADLCHANLSGADLRGADLRHADLRQANLFSADVRGADLSGADLRDALTEGALFDDPLMG